MSWHYTNIDPAPEINIPPQGGKDPHGLPRKEKVSLSLLVCVFIARVLQTAQDMMYQFFKTGQIANTCGGPCRGVAPSTDDVTNRPAVKWALDD